MQETAPDGKKPRVAQRSYLRPDEANRLIEAAGKRGRHPFRDRVLLRLIYRHALRASEATELRWSQIDLEGKNIHVERVKKSRPGNHPIQGDEVRDLRRLRRDAPGAYVFTTERGGKLSVDAIQYIVREAGKLANLDVVPHPHMLRHAAGYFLANEGHETRMIQEYLGHKDIRHTVRYTELSPRRLATMLVR